MLGALLLSSAYAGNTTNSPLETTYTLPLQLFEEADWQACRIECARILTSDSSPKIKLLHAVCGLRLGLDTKHDLQLLCNKRPPPYPEIAAMAHYELGKAYWNENNVDKAFEHLKASFLMAKSVETHQLSGCSLYLLIKENPKLESKDNGLDIILETCKREWKRDLYNRCKKTKKRKNSIATAPARGLIKFYQKQISPAIGSRCSLYPSCSHYAMQALKTHGVVGIGAMGDRFIREPDVVKYGKDPKNINGHIKYCDPLSNHDWWMKK